VHLPEKILAMPMQSLVKFCSVTSV